MQIIKITIFLIYLNKWLMIYTKKDLLKKKHNVIFRPPKTINKSEINRALKSLNQQMDEATEEFYQTGKKDDYYL